MPRAQGVRGGAEAALDPARARRWRRARGHGTPGAPRPSVTSTRSEILLVAVDFEQASLDALDTAIGLGRTLGLEVVILHVPMVPAAVYPGADPVMLPCRPEDVPSSTRRAAEELARNTGAARAIVRGGDAAEEILRVAEELRPAMVVVGTHGRSGLARLVLGSVAERVIRASPAPVLVIRARPRP